MLKTEKIIPCRPRGHGFDDFELAGLEWLDNPSDAFTAPATPSRRRRRMINFRRNTQQLAGPAPYLSLPDAPERFTAGYCVIVELRVVATEGVAEVSDAVSQIYREVYAEPLFLKFPRKFREDFSVRFRESAQQPGFEVILAISEIGYVGFIYGYTLTDPADWWRTVRLLKREDNARARKDFALWGDSISTVVIPQLLVRKGWRGVGIGRRLHDTFLVRRTEDLAALRVLPSNVAAKSAYQAWGWTTYGILEGLCGSPDLECMAKPLR